MMAIFGTVPWWAYVLAILYVQIIAGIFNSVWKTRPAWPASIPDTKPMKAIAVASLLCLLALWPLYLPAWLVERGVDGLRR